jgi:hypothetical protein
MPAILFGIAQAKDAGFGGFPVQLAREFAFGFPAVDVRRNLSRVTKRRTL